MNESLESNSEKRNIVEEIKSIEEISTCKVTRCTNEIHESTYGMSISGNESTESLYKPSKSTGEVNELNNFQVEKKDDDRKEAVMKNTVSNDKVKNLDKMTTVNDEERGAIIVGRTLGIKNEFEHEKVLGSETSNAGESLNKALCEQKKEDAVEVKIYNATSHTTPLVEENLKHSHASEKGKEQKMKEDMDFLGEAKISSGVGSYIQRSRKVLRKAEVPAVEQRSHEYMKTKRNNSKRLEEILSDSNTDDIEKNDEIKSGRSIKCKRTDEKGKRRHTSYSTRRKSSCSSRDFEREVSNSPGHRKRKSRYSSGHKSSLHWFKDENVSNSKDHGIDVAHFSGWYEKESYDIQKHATPNRYSYEEDECRSWAVKELSYKERSYERKSSNQRLYKKESEQSLYWHDNDSNSSWNEFRDCEEKDQYMSDDVNEIQGNEGDTEGTDNRPLLSSLIQRSGMMINQDIRRKFAKACVSFLKTINQVPSCSQENYADDDWHSDEDAEPQYNQERIYSQRARCNNEIDAERHYGQDWSCSPKLGYSSDEWYTNQNSRNSSRNKSYNFERHHREHDASYSTSHSRRRSISGAERQHGQDWLCSPEMGYNPDEWYTDQNSRGSSRNRQYNSWRHHGEHDASHSASHSQRHGYASSITDDDEKMEVQSSIYRHSNEKIRKQCERERDPATRRALLSLFDAHDHECSHYLKQPDAHPDYNKEYRSFFQNKTKSILELGGDPNTFNFHYEWKKYWPSRMNALFIENWKTKMQLCTSFLTQKNNSSSSESSTDLDSSSASSSSSDDSTDSSTREKGHSYSKRKKKLRYSKSKAISAKGKRKQEKNKWKPINEVVMNTDDITLELDIKRYRETSESLSVDKCKLNKQEVDADDMTLELDIKRYRERSESHSVDKCKRDKQASVSPHLQNQNNQGSMAIQVVDVLKVLHHIKERFDELEKPLNSLYLKAINLKENNLDTNEILKEEECCSILLKLGEKLEKMLEDKNLTVIQKVITREVHERFSHLLLRIREKKSQHMGLDIGSIARITMGKDEGETLTFIKNSLLYQGHPCVSDENLINIYLEVKEEHKNIEYLSSTQTLMSHKNSVFSVSQDESNPSYVEPSKLCQSECQPNIQPFSVYTQPVISSAHPDSHSSLNVPPDAAPMMLDSIENNATRTLKPASLLQSSTNSRKKTSSLVPSTDFKTKVKTPPVELKKISSVDKDHPTRSEPSSPSASPLVTSPALPIKTDLSAPTVLVSQVEVIPSTSETLTTVSECELMSDSKLYQNTIKDCFTSPSSSPKKDLPSFSLQDCAKLDFENPFSSSLGISPFEFSINTGKLWDRSSDEIIPSESVSKTNKNSLLECHANSKSSKHSDESGSNVERHEESSTGVSKKPIRITIPQLSKKKAFIDSIP